MLLEWKRHNFVDQYVTKFRKIPVNNDCHYEKVPKESQAVYNCVIISFQVVPRHVTFVTIPVFLKRNKIIMITQLLQATNLLVFVITVTSPFGGPSVGLTSAQVVVPTISPAQPNPVAPFSTTNSNETSSDAPSDQPSDTPSLSPSTNPSSSPTTPMGLEANIVGGDLAQTGEFEFFAWAYNSITGPCGGTLIFQDIILTAASCGCDFFLDNTIYIGGTLRDGSDARDIAVALECLEHPDYIAAIRYNDIMLVKLVSPSPAQLVTLLFDDTAESFETATTIGYGYTDYGSSEAFFLRKIETTILPDDVCEQRFMSGDDPSVDENFDPDYRTSFNLCTTSQSGGICSGDVGGPLLLEGNVQVGIASYAIGLNSCGLANEPAVYTQISEYLKWIADNSCGTCKFLVVCFHFSIHFFQI